MKRVLTVTAALLIVLLTACQSEPSSIATPTGSGGAAPAAGGALPSDAAAVAQERGLSPDDIYAAVKTYTPSGKTDPYIMIASGGQSGQVLVIGVPSMRILKVIAVFTPESWQGYGFGGSGDKVLAEGKVNDKEVLWGDTHHPALSETDASYDGQFAFINDKANARVAVIDLRDFSTKQIVKNPNKSDRSHVVL